MKSTGRGKCINLRSFSTISRAKELKWGYAPWESKTEKRARWCFPVLPLIFHRNKWRHRFFWIFFSWFLGKQRKKSCLKEERQAGNNKDNSVVFVFALLFFHPSLTPPGKKSLHPWITLLLYPTTTLYRHTKDTGDAFDQISLSRTAVVVVFEFLFCFACTEDLNSKTTRTANPGEQKSLQDESTRQQHPAGFSLIGCEPMQPTESNSNTTTGSHRQHYSQQLWPEELYSMTRRVIFYCEP